MSAARPLPAQFAALAPFVAEWALPSEAARLKKLTATSIVELKDFYDAMFARAEEIKAYLMPLRLDAMPEDARTLFDLLLTFIETAHPIELNWTTTDIDDAFALDRMTIADLPAFPPR
jgi:hypothetical protein